MEKKDLFILGVILLGLGLFLFGGKKADAPTIAGDFEECVAQGNPVMESYPRQCADKSGNSFTEIIEPIISQEEAFAIAQENTDCSTVGILTHKPEEIYNNVITRTWWFGLERMPELENDGCNPACVVNEETKTAEVNWMCTGAKDPIGRVTCKDEQRDVDACIEIYQPVCATVNIQCITTPCDPIEETFSNSCFACQNPLVSNYAEGECGESL